MSLALGAGLGGQAVVAVDPLGAEGIEGPVLEEDVDGLAERGSPGGQDGRGLELVVGPGEEDKVQGFVHGGHLDVDDWEGPAGDSAAGAGPTAFAAISPRRVRRRSSTVRMSVQATMTSGSTSR